jgi:8-amino-7-oxononanoate synthase
MKAFPDKLKHKLEQRQQANALRQLGSPNNLIDFSSNDYLGFACSEILFDKTHAFLVTEGVTINGATGSRLLSGNHNLYPIVENLLCDFHKSSSALVFNSGYDANLGFFSAVPQRGDVILYDEYSHASIRDGISMSLAKSYKFKHNNLQHLKELLERFQDDNQDIYVVTESVFSMDGDATDLKALTQICHAHQAYLVIDEAHALGVFGAHGCGLVQELGLEDAVFARIMTFGKGLGCHGAAILGDTQLKQFLINFARSFIYTTGLSPHALATIKVGYEALQTTNALAILKSNIEHFQSELKRLDLESEFIKSNSAIHSCIISGNTKVKSIALQLHNESFDVKAILSPTVPKGQERLRFCLHAYNSKTEITHVLERLRTFVSNE